MYYFIKGKLISKDKDSAVLETNNIGFQIFIGQSFSKQIELNQEIKIYVYLLVKQETLELYGFATEQELKYAKILNNISGIGPKLSLKLLSLTKIADLEKAILDEDLKFLTQVSGIGKKSAQRIILELKEKISQTPFANLDEEKQIFEALKNLGYSSPEIRNIIFKIPVNLSLEEKIKQAIKLLSKN